MPAPNSPAVIPVQRDCPRAACRASGVQCTERRENQPCKEGAMS